MWLKLHYYRCDVFNRPRHSLLALTNEIQFLVSCKRILTVTRTYPNSCYTIIVRQPKFIIIDTIIETNTSTNQGHQKHAQPINRYIPAQRVRIHVVWNRLRGARTFQGCRLKVPLWACFLYFSLYSSSFHLHHVLVRDDSHLEFRPVSHNLFSLHLKCFGV